MRDHNGMSLICIYKLIYINLSQDAVTTSSSPGTWTLAPSNGFDNGDNRAEDCPNACADVIRVLSRKMKTG